MGLAYHAGPAYLYYRQLLGFNSSARRVNITCPLNDWAGLLAARGGASSGGDGLPLAPCGTATVTTGQQLLEALQALQPGHARVLVTLDASVALPAQPTPARADFTSDDTTPLVAVYRNTTLAGGAPRQSRSWTSGSAATANMPHGPSSSWPLGLMSILYYGVGMDRSGTGGLQLVRLRAPKVFAPGEADSAPPPYRSLQPLVAGRAEDRSDSSVVAMQLCLTMQWCEAGTLRDALQKGMFGAPSDQPTGRAQVAAPGASTSSSRGLDGANASAAGVAATAAAPLEPPSPTVASGTGAEAAAAGMAPAPVDAAAAAAAADDDDDDDASAALSAAAAALGGARTRVTSWDDLTPVHNLALALLAARDVLSGLEYLHRCAVVHGDLTGSNILLKRVWPVLPAAPAVAGPSGDAAPAAAHSGGGRRAPPGSPTSAAATANAVPLLCVTAPHSALDTARVAEPGPPAAAVAEVARRLLRHSFKIADFGLSVQMKGPDQTHASNMAQVGGVGAR
ncbi:hypothetical protein TSOC_010915 [Tetrabaena socialis]|uniref:Uncharacterized protein n=1 Tax=Tetrabaena socialis TaxID=47790 RepID=A0A2J7ZS21_9CHLO|nr:hypothetical protein TSOC_010915 [Tetrabaena socialis]|eukprot:PNH03058.1 hypothetical protein TSOC_010915 [Tetrabaena socialis]